jgi:acyl-CoA reductase-like NAD-dependent aldehyde dehydrogenase
MFLDGTPAPSATGQELEVRSPWDGRVVGTVPRDGAGQVEAGLRAIGARRRVLPVAERAKVLETVARLLTERGDELPRLISAESGVCLRETRNEVRRSVGNLMVAAHEASALRGESIPIPGHDRLAVTVLEPAGTVAAITPFNRPLNQVVVKVAPAVAAGCAIALKPSEKTPLTALLFAELLVRAGFPPENLMVTTGDPRVVGPALVGHRDVDMVTFTGGVAAGRAVAAASAGKKHLLELGGNDPLIVFPDADLDRAAKVAAAGAFSTAGQSCRGVKRVIAVGEATADALVPRIAAEAARRRAGDPLDPETDLGPLVSEEAALVVEKRIADALSRGASLVQGGTRERALMVPTVLDHVPGDAELVVEETFGPVAPVIRVAGVREAVAVANSTEYGLQAGVLTRDVDAFWQVASALRVGAVNLGEGPNFDSPHIPFGGVKSSGVGREGIRYAIREMTTVKTITVPYPGPGGTRT